VKQLGVHLGRLAVGTAQTWVRYLPWLIGFTLFAWAGEYASLLASSVVAPHVPYLVILGLSVSLIIQLLMIVLALRKVGTLVGWSSSSPLATHRIIDIAILPFLGLYVAFGYVNDDISNLLFLIQGRTNFYQLSTIIGDLNPMLSTTRLIWVLAALVGLYIVGQVLDALREKSTSFWLDLASALVTSFGTFLGLLSAFRIWDWVQQWMHTRNIAAWNDTIASWVSSVVHIPDVLSRAWEFFSATLWPGFWDLLVQPLVWFALAILVAGGRFMHLDEVVARVAPPSTNKVVNFLRNQIQGRILGDLDDKVVPLLHALRRMWKATVPFLAAYILAFTVCTWVGEGFKDLAWRLLGMQDSSTLVIVLPLVDAISSVFILSVKLALLVVAFSQAEKLATSPPAKKTSAGTTVLIVAACFALAVVHTLTLPSDVTVRSGEVGDKVNVIGVQVSVSDIRVGTTVDVDGYQDDTDQRFVVIHLSAYSDTVRTSLRSTIVAGGHTYQTYDTVSWLDTEPGFLTEKDMTFEVELTDLTGPIYIVTHPYMTLRAQIEEAKFTIDINPAGTAGVTVTAEKYQTERVP